MHNLMRRGLTAAAAGVALSLPLTFALTSAAGADLSNPPVTLSAPSPSQPSGSPVTPATPYSSGQDINITVAINSILANAGTTNIQIEECSDPGGTTANLPTSFSTCDSLTKKSGNVLNTDGSLTYNNYPIYILPDPYIGLLESSGSPANCGLAPNFCVLYIGTGATGNNFTAPKVFSAPFQVQENSAQDDGGENPGDGTPEAPLAIGLPLVGLGVVGGTLYVRRRRRARAA